MNKKLLVAGPTEIEGDILALGALPQVYMRTPQFSARLKNIHKNLQYVFQTCHPVLIFTSSGTGMLDAAISNFLFAGEQAIVINGGSFGQRWVDICHHYSVTAHEITVEFGKSVQLQDVERIIQQYPESRALYATLNETSSGALTDIQGIGQLLKNYPDILFVVDCVSGLLADEFQMDAWGVDVTIAASQKALAIPPGLGFMALNNKAIARAETAGLSGYYFNVLISLRDWRRHQTPFTPAISLLFQLERRLEKIKAEGLTALRQRYQQLTERLRNGLQLLGFHVLAGHPSNCVTAVMSRCYYPGHTGNHYCNYNAKQIISLLENKYSFMLAPSAGEWQTKLFRIGNFGHITGEDIDRFLLALQETIKELSDD